MENVNVLLEQIDSSIQETSRMLLEIYNYAYQHKNHRFLISKKRYETDYITLKKINCYKPNCLICPHSIIWLKINVVDGISWFEKEYPAGKLPRRYIKNLSIDDKRKIEIIDQSISKIILLRKSLVKIKRIMVLTKINNLDVKKSMDDFTKELIK